MSPGRQGHLGVYEQHGESWLEEGKPSPAGRTAPSATCTLTSPSLLTSKSLSPHLCNCSCQVTPESLLSSRLRVSGSLSLLVPLSSLLFKFITISSWMGSNRAWPPLWVCSPPFAALQFLGLWYWHVYLHRQGTAQLIL